MKTRKIQSGLYETVDGRFLVERRESWDGTQEWYISTADGADTFEVFATKKECIAYLERSTK